MRIERFLWAGLVLALLIVIGILAKKKSDLEYSFLADRDYFRIIRADSIKRLNSYYGETPDKIDEYFFVSYLFPQNKVCIRFASKPNVRGEVDNIYCYKDEKHTELVDISGPTHP